MIIGSNVIKYYFPDFPREPKDYDIVAFDTYEKQDLIRIYKDVKHCKVEVLINPVLVNWFKNAKGSTPGYCPINELYTLKMSHVFWDINWEKHMWDIQWLKEKGCALIKPLFFELYDYWNSYHGTNKRSNLKMSSDEFFDNAVNFPIAHDDLHLELVKHPYFKNEPPTYTKILIGEVEVCENKFNNLTELEKFNLVFEEVAVMAIERYGNLFYKIAFNKMLKKFIISHAPIWEAIWIIENHKLLLTNIPYDFIREIKGVY